MFISANVENALFNESVPPLLTNAQFVTEMIVCIRYGERLYSQENIQRFEEIRRKLEQEDTEGFEAIGQLFHVRSKMPAVGVEPTRGSSLTRF